MNQATVQEPQSRKSFGTQPENTSPHHSEHEEDNDHGHVLNWLEVARVVFVAAAAGAMWFLGRSTNPYIIAMGVICAVVGGFPIFHEAYKNIAQRRMTMELSMAIAIVAALAIRELFTALVITLFVLPLLLAAFRGALRVVGVTEAIPSCRSEIMAQSWIYILLAVLVPYLYLYNFCASLIGRRLRWRGIEYELISPEQTRVRSSR